MGKQDRMSEEDKRKDMEQQIADARSTQQDHQDDEHGNPSSDGL